MILRTSKDKRLRAKIEQLELKKLKHKLLFTSVLNDNNLNKKQKALCLSLLNEQKIENASKTKLVNRCLLTHKSRIMYKAFKVNRMKLKDMLQMGILPGYKKAVW